MRILPLLVALAVPASAGAQTVTTAGPLLPASHSSLHRFSCPVESGKDAGGEVEIEDRRTEAGSYAGELKRLSFGGHDVPEKTMKLIRDAIGSRAMDIVEPSCDKMYVAVMIRVYSPTQAAHQGLSWIVVTHSKDGQISISEG
jgi:hypothetical protein